MRPLLAHCRLGLGRLYRRIGKRQHVPRDGHAVLAGAGAVRADRGRRMTPSRARPTRIGDLIGAVAGE
jgi:hypothetical protein